MRRHIRQTAAAVAVALLTSGCFGSFTLTRKVYHFNETVSSDRWVRELAFLLMAWVPVYSISSLADAIVFNSIEFWTGSNPLTTADASSVKTKRISRNDGETVLTSRMGAQGQELLIDQYRYGKLVTSLLVHKQDGRLVASDQSGQTVFTTETLADGSVKVSDGSGKQTALYTPAQAEAILKAVR